LQVRTPQDLHVPALQLRSSSLGHALLVKRRNWRSAEDDVASLTIDQLEDAAKAVANGGFIDDPVIQRLQRNMVTIGMQVPESFLLEYQVLDTLILQLYMY
jgi:hypothetical protein